MGKIIGKNSFSNSLSEYISEIVFQSKRLQSTSYIYIFQIVLLHQFHQQSNFKVVMQCNGFDSLCPILKWAALTCVYLEKKKEQLLAPHKKEG